jgi:glycine oxidase
MKSSSEVVILGGGVIGLTTAYYLARAGVRVVLCDQGKVGQEASWAGAGILPPSEPTTARDPADRLRAMSGRLFPALSEELRQETGIDNGFIRCGGLEWPDLVEESADQEWYGEGVATENVAEAALRQLEPALAPNLGPARRVPGMAQLRNPRHLQALTAACARTGRVTVRESDAAQELVIEHGRVRAVRTTTSTLTGDTFLLATGAWTERLLQPLGRRPGIRPVRGQIVLLNASRVLFRHILAWGARYLVPRLDGRVLAGSTEELAGFEKRNTAEGVQGLLELATRLVPALAEASLERCWSGLRPGSPDGLPFLGPVPGVSNLLIAAGHFRAGIQLSPGTAWLMKELILGEPLSLSLEAFRLDRAVPPIVQPEEESAGREQRTCR